MDSRSGFWSAGELLHRYTTVHEPGGVLPIACKTRRASRCPPCAEVYRADTYQLIRVGLSGGKGVPATVADHPCIFVTLTAPSFGPVHSRREKDGRLLRCRPRRVSRTCLGPRTRHSSDHDYRGADRYQGRRLCSEVRHEGRRMHRHSRPPHHRRRSPRRPARPRPRPPSHRRMPAPGQAPPAQRAATGRLGAHARLRGHFSTKSRAYSTTMGAIRADRAAYQREAAIAAGLLPDLEGDTTLVINDWHFVGRGHLPPIAALAADLPSHAPPTGGQPCPGSC